MVPPQPGGEPFSHQLENLLRNPVDRPGPRLLDALENPHDRIFVVKLEKDLINFIEDKRSFILLPLPPLPFFSPHFLVETTLVITPIVSCDIFDMPPIDFHHCPLAHQMAEYYRLTHEADSTGASVRIFCGQAARMYDSRANFLVLSSSFFALY